MVITSIPKKHNMKKNLYYSKKIFTLSFGVFALWSCSSDTDLAETVNSDENNVEQDVPEQVTSFLNVSDFELPEQDENGFTVLKAQSDSRIIYVHSSNGNDSTGEIYGVDSPEVGENPFAPSDDIKAYATIAAAQENMRDNQADVLLLAAGEVWNESLKLTHGKSINERSIYGTYGEGNRPELRTGYASGITNLQITNVIVSGIKFWAHSRDDEGAYFESLQAGDPGFNFYNDLGRPVLNVLIEDCFFRSYTGNVITGVVDEGKVKMEKIVLRRNIVSRNYSPSSHSQGLFYSGSGDTGGTTILLEENIFDHNGWRIQNTTGDMSADNGQAVFFNHNTYFANAKGVLFYGNIFLKSSSMGNKWTANNGMASSRDIALINNLYVDGEIGISMGGNESGPLRFQNVMISDNVFSNIGKSQPTNRTLAWGLTVKDWDGGEVKNNLFIHQKNTAITNMFAVNINTESESRNISFTNNIAYGLTSEGGSLSLFRITDEGTVGNINISENYMYESGNSAIITYDGESGFTFSKNNYMGINPNGEWFHSNGNSMDIDAWRSSYESDAEILDLSSWPEPERDVDGYISMLGKGSSIEDFANSLYEQSRNNWDVNLTAPYINQWIKGGFNR